MIPSGLIGHHYLNERNKMIELVKWAMMYSSGAYVVPEKNAVPYLFNTRREALHETSKFVDAKPVKVTISIEQD